MVGYGSTACCFRMSDGRIAKLYLNTENTDHLFRSYKNMEEHMQLLHEVSNDSFIGPEELIIKDNKVIGYIYPYLEGTTLAHINKNTKLSTLYNAYCKLIEDTLDISSKSFKLIDVHKRNIIFDGSNYKVIDLDKGKSKINEKNGTNTAEVANICQIKTTVINSLFKGDFDDILVFSDFELEKIHSKMWKKEEDIYDFYRLLQSRCDSSDPTLKEIRKKVRYKIKENDYIRKN